MMSYIADFIESLRVSVLDRGFNALEKIKGMAILADELEEVFCCYSALACWGEPGFQAIFEVALDGAKVKHKSAALIILAELSFAGKIVNNGAFFQFSPMSDFFNQFIKTEEAKTKSRHKLRLLILSLRNEELMIPLSQAFIFLINAQAGIVDQLVLAMSSKWLRFGPPLLSLYEKMIVEGSNDEPQFQKFFCEYPQFLEPMAVQVWPQPDFHGAFEPDFVIRRSDNTYLVVEIECPGKQLVTKANHLSSAATHAETQALEYENFLSARYAESRVNFPGYRRADCLAVVGLEQSLSLRQREALETANSRRQNSKIVGFDWLLERARAVILNIGEGGIEVMKNHRMI